MPENTNTSAFCGDCGCLLGSCQCPDPLVVELRAENERLRAGLDLGVDGRKLMQMLEQAQVDRDRYKAALQKIAEPMKYHHWEEDAYTRAACFQFVADEALKEPK